ncbi:MAG: hypothetical protein R2708_08020 [Vicinamibacterales bacterium]
MPDRTGRRRAGARALALVPVMAACASLAMAQGLPAPGNLQATSVGQAVTFTWDTSVFPPYRVRVDAGLTPGATDVSFLPEPVFPYSLVVYGVPSGTYYVRLRLEKDGQISAPSNEAVVTVGSCQGLPDPPQLLAGVAGQTVTLQWTYTFPTGCPHSSLRLEAGSAPGASDVLSVDIADYNLTQRQFGSVPFGTYYVRVRANRFGVLGPPSDEVRLDVACLPPPPLIDPQATVVGNAVRFSWAYGTQVSADFSVQLEAGSQSGAADIGVLPVPAEAFAGFNVDGAAGGYFTRLRATNACGSTVSAEMPVTLTSECVPPQAVPFADAALGINRMSLTWQPAISGGLVTSYDLQVGAAPGAQDEVARQTVDGRYTPRFGAFTATLGAPPERAYASITPRNACGAGPPTLVYAANNGTCANPAAPRDLSAFVNGGTVTLQWTGTLEGTVLGSFVEIGTSPGASDVLTGQNMGASSAPYFQTTLPAGRYYARSRAVTLGGCSDISNPSPEVSFVIP